MIFKYEKNASINFVPSLNRAGSEQIDVLYFIVKSNIWYFMVTCTVDSNRMVHGLTTAKLCVSHIRVTWPHISLNIQMVFYMESHYTIFPFRSVNILYDSFCNLSWPQNNSYNSNFFRILDKTVFGIHGSA